MESKLKYHQGAIHAVIAYDKKRIYHNTMVRVPKMFLDSRNLVKSSQPNAKDLNQIILKKKKELDHAILEDMKNGDLDLDRVRAILKGEHLRQDTVDLNQLAKTRLADIIKQFVVLQINVNRNLKWRYELMIEEAEKITKACKDITPQDIFDFLQRTYLRKDYDAEIHDSIYISENTQGTRCKNFKRVYEWALKKQFPLPDIEWKKIKPKGYKADFVVLDIEKLKQLREYNPTEQHYQRVRDIFLVLCYTGMRYSDYLRLSDKDIHNNYIVKVENKTTTRFRIPISKHIAHIVHNRPPKMANQVFNRSIKEIGQKLGWDEEVMIRQSLKSHVTKKFYECLKSHIGRHTAATQWLTNGIKVPTVMSWTGWSQDDMAYYYSDLMKTDTDKEMELIDNL
jgi:integrase